MKPGRMFIIGSTQVRFRAGCKQVGNSADDQFNNNPVPVHTDQVLGAGLINRASTSLPCPSTPISTDRTLQQRRLTSLPNAYTHASKTLNPESLRPNFWKPKPETLNAPNKILRTDEPTWSHEIPFKGSGGFVVRLFVSSLSRGAVHARHF